MATKKVTKSRYPLFKELAEGEHYYHLTVELYTETSKDSDNYMKSEYRSRLEHLKDKPIPEDIASLDTSFHMCEVNNGELSLDMYATSLNEITKYMTDLFQAHKNALLDARATIESKDWGKLSHLIAVAFYDTTDDINVSKEEYIETTLSNKEAFDKSDVEIGDAIEWIDSKLEELDRVMDKTRRKIERVKAAKADYEQYITIYDNWEV